MAAVRVSAGWGRSAVGLTRWESTASANAWQYVEGVPGADDIVVLGVEVAGVGVTGADADAAVAAAAAAAGAGGGDSGAGEGVDDVITASGARALRTV
jgi:hypothetical protein